MDWGDMPLPPIRISPSLGPSTLPSLSPTPEESEEDPEQTREQERQYRIIQDPGNLARTYREAAQVAMQQDALQSIDVDDVDLTLNSHAIHYHRARIERSVVRPGRRIKSPQARLSEEEELVVPDAIDLDCDQVRVMIKRFVDKFRRALGSHGHEIDRKKMSAFLQRSGPEDGNAMLVYQLAWEFSKRVGLLTRQLRVKFANTRRRESFSDCLSQLIGSKSPRLLMVHMRDDRGDAGGLSIMRRQPQKSDQDGPYRGSGSVSMSGV